MRASVVTRPTHLSGAFALEDYLLGARLLWRLRSHLRRCLSLPEARRILQTRLDDRDADFLHLVRRTIYDAPVSPYRLLLRHAGCEYGDLERLVHREGVEGAMRLLYREGIYLTVEEFKGRCPVVRGSSTFTLSPADLRNPEMRVDLLGQSSGSRNPRTTVPMDLAFIRDRAVNAFLTLDARTGADWRKAVWADIGGCLALTIRFSSFGRRSERAFSLVDPAEMHPSYRWSARALRWGSCLAGMPLPRLEHVPVENPLPIARWIERVLREGARPHIWTYVSPAVRLCQAASAAGMNLEGTQFTVTGEPVTAARLAAIRAAGADAAPDYGSAESGFIGYGCLAPEAPDDVHVFDDLHAVIRLEVPDDEAGLPAGALLVSSLRTTAPLILLNVSMGDRAQLGRRSCGCPLERLGWRVHLHTIRSFEKLTAGGMTVLDGDVIRVLEEVLPGRFGGVPTDYQLVESHGGSPRLRLILHPSLGPLDADAVARTFLAAIGSSSASNRMMATHWQEAGLLSVERRPPHVTPSGKILHVHREG